MTSALIGHSGFVGSNLNDKRSFTALYNSKTIGSIEGESLDLAICAAAPATMWAANRDPDKDKANLSRLVSALEQARIERFVLISTIAVFDDPAAGYTEQDARYEQHKAYGRHRRDLELWAQDHFEHCHVVRLPALFGPGLKKNFIFDLLNPVPSFLSPQLFERLNLELSPRHKALLAHVYDQDGDLGMHVLDREKLAASSERQELEDGLREANGLATSFTNSRSQFQLYDLRRLADDIDRIVGRALPVINMASEPLSASAIAKRITGEPFENDAPALYAEDMRTCHAETLGGRDGYLYTAPETLSALDQFVEGVRA